MSWNEENTELGVEGVGAFIDVVVFIIAVVLLPLLLMVFALLRSSNEENRELGVGDVVAFIIALVFLPLLYILRAFAYPFLLIGAAVEKNREERGEIKRKTMKVYCDSGCVPANEYWDYPTTEHEIEIPGFCTQMVNPNWRETRHKKACPGYAKRSWEKRYGHGREPRWGYEVPKSRESAEHIEDRLWWLVQDKTREVEERKKRLIWPNRKS